MICFSVKIIAEEVYDSFILEIRGRREQGNVTYPGKWVQIPKIAKTMTCDRFKGAAVVDKGIFNSNATFKRLFIINSTKITYLKEKLRRHIILATFFSLV